MNPYLTEASRTIPQTEALAGQVQNSQGGFSFGVDDWGRLSRFLILGSEGGSYYASEKTLTRENAKVVERCLKLDGPRVVREIVAISDAGRAPKNDPAIYALALAAKTGDDATRKLANEALPHVCRIGTHLYHYAAFVNALGGWGRGTRRAIGNWFNGKTPSDLAYQLVKYQSRDGWSARDLLRLSHPRAASADHAALYHWACKHEGFGDLPLPGIIEAFEKVKAATSEAEVATLIRDHNLPREAIPTQWLTQPSVWAALADKMPITATIRNLATMTRVGLLTSGLNFYTDMICARITSADHLAKGRVHPIAILSALKTYQSGHSVRGTGTWTPVTKIVDALDAAFYQSFGYVEPTGLHQVLALDVSGSMTSGEVAGVPGLTPRMASVAMAMVTAAVEKHHTMTCFSTRYSGLDISPRRRLDDNIAMCDNIPFGGTDCSLPMVHALSEKATVDTFVIYTDSETAHGGIHPVKALQAYRRWSGRPAKLVVVGMVSNGFSIADPNDPGMLDVVGFDTATPNVISGFAKG